MSYVCNLINELMSERLIYLLNEFHRYSSIKDNFFVFIFNDGCIMDFIFEFICE